MRKPLLYHCLPMSEPNNTTASGSAVDEAAPADPPPLGALAAALDRVGDRWSLLLVEALLPGPRRFNDLLDQIPGIAPNILSERLKRLERDALLVSRPYTDRPRRAAYGLTAGRKELAGALRLVAHWGSRHSHPAEAPRHPACGTPLEVRWYCPTCDQLVEDGPESEMRFL